MGNKINELIENKKVFFIFGSPRSGTSLLSRILNAHSNIAVPPESLIYNNFFDKQDLYSNLAIKSNQLKLLQDILATYDVKNWRPPISFDMAADLIKEPGFNGVFDAVLSAWALSQNIYCWGEKTPRHVFYWEQLKSYYPDAKILHIVRDGRDVCSSILKARFGPKTYYSAAKLWTLYLREMEHIKKNTSANQIFELKYEELLANPKTVLKDICYFLEEEYTDDLLRFYIDDSPYMTDAINEKNLRNPLMKTNAYKWKNELNERSVRIIESIASDYLKKYDYENINASAQISIGEKMYFQYLLGPIKKIIAMLKNKQGHEEAAILFYIFAKRKILNIVEK